MFKLLIAAEIPFGSSCPYAALSVAGNNYVLHIPILIFTGTSTSYWLDFTYVPTSDGLYWFKLTGYGINTYTVTPSAGANGAITPNTAQTINSGATTTFTVTPNSGYTTSVGGTCGGTLTGTTYTTNAITADCTVVASFIHKYTDNGDGTVTDNSTSLTWQQGENSAQGYNWFQASGTCDISNNPSCQNVCDSLSLAGGGWRLPTKEELASLDGIDTNFFPNAYAGGYWSSTTDGYGTDFAWSVYFYNSYVYNDFKSSSHYVHCVRG